MFPPTTYFNSEIETNVRAPAKLINVSGSSNVDDVRQYTVPAFR